MAAAGKLEQEQLAKLADLGELQGKLDSGELVAIDAQGTSMKAEAVNKAEGVRWSEIELYTI